MNDLFDPTTINLIKMLIPVAGIVVGTTALSSLGHKPNPDSDKVRREKARYPQPPKEMLFDCPKGIVLGKYKDKYVCQTLLPDEKSGRYGDGKRILLLGGSGTGKTSTTILDTIYAAQTDNRHVSDEERVSLIVIDIKGELSDKGAADDDPYVKIVSLTERNFFGIDFMMSLGKNPSSQDLLEWATTISESIIPVSGNDKDRFWKVSARNLFIGLLIFYYNEGNRTLIDLVDRITERPIRDSIDAVMENAREGAVERRYVAGFAAMADDTLGSVNGSLMPALTCFNYSDVRYQLKYNKSKVSPQDTENGYSIYFRIEESKIDRLSSLIQLICNMWISELETRRENVGRPVLWIMDETGRIVHSSGGKIEKLEGALMTLRSKRVSFIICSQSLSSLLSAWSKDELTSMMENCDFKQILSATSSDTQKEIISWCGKYRQRKDSWSSGDKSKSTSTSYDDKEIFSGADLVELPEREESILVGRHFYTLRKVPYYTDKYLPKLQ